MLFNSIHFAFFLPVVFFLYWYVFRDRLRLQNLFLVGASYLFYGWWDWRFLSLIIFSSWVDYTIGLKLDAVEDQRKRKIALLISIFVNLGFLAIFKYYNFFIANFIASFAALGVDLNITSINIILPVGISFYTFQTMSYTIDVYRKKLKPTDDVVAFFAFVSFFPQLVAGPIERATNLLPQFYKKREFSYTKAKDGLRQILWGLFKKIVIADNASTYVNYIFENHDTLPATSLWLGVIYFSFQIYGDFSGYSDIAIGTSRLFGFNLMRNFAYPYFSRDIAEFWRRWHISLSTWFRDYLYIPLGGSKGGTKSKVKNTLIIFVVSGFWHGSNWTFIAWGLLNGLYFLPLLLRKKNRKNMDIVAAGKIFPSFVEIYQILFTFILTNIAWVFFRSRNISDAFSYLSGMFSTTIMEAPINGGIVKMVPLIILMVSIEWIQRNKQFGLEISKIKWFWVRWFIYYILILIIILFGGQQESFIYFQF